ncbi:hypothetical protein MRX96_037188 [Rhipicephalus microplus]
MNEIMDHIGVFLAFAHKEAHSDLTPVTFNESTAFFEFTPTVSKERWEAILNQYIDKPMDSCAGVTINGIDYFKAVFEMHSNGEDVMNDILEALAVQNLVPFTSMEMIMSFHKAQGEQSARALIHTCLDLLYPGFGYVVNQQLLLDYETTWGHLKELADRLRATFIKSTQDPSQNQTMLMDNPSASKSNHTIEIVFGLLDRSVPSQFPSAYENYPDIADDPLENWGNLDKYYS